MQVQDAETAIMQEQEEKRNAEKARSTTKKPEDTFKEMLNAIRDSVSDLESSDNEEDAEDEEDDEEDAELGKLSNDDEPGWVIGTISKSVQHCLDSFRQKQMKLHELRQLGCGDSANCFRERDIQYRTAEWMVPAVVHPQIDTTAATPSTKTFGNLMQTLDNIPGKSQMPKWLLDHQAVKLGGGRRHHTHSYASSVSCLRWCPIHHRLVLRSWSSL